MNRKLVLQVRSLSKNRVLEKLPAIRKTFHLNKNKIEKINNVLRRIVKALITNRFNCSSINFEQSCYFY